jgi:hypothetical protein
MVLPLSFITSAALNLRIHSIKPMAIPVLRALLTVLLQLVTTCGFDYFLRLMHQRHLQVTVPVPAGERAGRMLAGV